MLPRSQGRPLVKVQKFVTIFLALEKIFFRNLNLSKIKWRICIKIENCDFSVLNFGPKAKVVLNFKEALQFWTQVPRL